MEKLLTQISEAITTMAAEIKSLKDWREACTKQEKQEQEEAEATVNEFNAWLQERQAAELKQRQDAEALKKLMI